MDIKTVFLNNELEEEVFTEQPKDFVTHGQEKLKSTRYIRLCRVLNKP